MFNDDELGQMYIWVTGRCRNHWLFNYPASIPDETR